MSSRYRELCAKVDAFTERVRARHGDELRCGPGCDSCCRTRLTVTGVEAAALTEAIGALAPAARAHLGAVARRPFDPGAPRCAALDDDGRCLVYDGRPLVCRSHGVPVRLYGEFDGKRLPIIDACPKNFTTRGPAGADADCVLDQETLSATLMAIDAADADARGRPRGERFALTDLVVAATADDE